MLLTHSRVVHEAIIIHLLQVLHFIFVLELDAKADKHPELDGLPLGKDNGNRNIENENYDNCNGWNESGE